MQNKVCEIGKIVNGMQFVLCKEKFGSFEKGLWYNISSIYGNPQGALEAGLEFMTTEFLSSILVMDKEGDEFIFHWKNNQSFAEGYKFFQDVFIYDLNEYRDKQLNNLLK